MYWFDIQTPLGQIPIGPYSKSDIDKLVSDWEEAISENGAPNVSKIVDEYYKPLHFNDDGTLVQE
jgi:hypothetical protein